jgi:HD-GYP domain-containing protein (c-di-GMP phosphodiesterase class II)
MRRNEARSRQIFSGPGGWGQFSTMTRTEQKVSVGDLKVGMYVSRLDRPWLETRFLFQGFHITNSEDIRDLRERCEYVYVDPERGEAAAAPLKTLRRLGDFDKFTDVFRNKTGKDRYPVVTTVEEEIGACRESRQRAFDVISTILDDVRAGRKVKMQAVREAVSGMVGSIIRNPDAFFWLTRLKDKDAYAYSHCVDACGLAIAFGRYLGFSKAELEDLAAGTLLFDIGKLQLPESLLKKPGRLTDKEYALIRRHVEFGVKMVGEIKGTNKDIVRVVLYHHERHNGSGYPRGVPGHKIPVNGRIAALVDCYDAITSERAYSNAVSPYEAIRMIYEWRDKDFQTDMVEQFIQCIGLYPTGTLVELSSGEVGIVLAQNRVRRLRPKVMLVLDKNKIAYEFNPTLDLIQDPLDDNGNPVEIRRPLEPGTYGIHARDFYL